MCFWKKKRFKTSDELLRDQIAAGRIKIQDFGQYNSDGSISKITDPQLTARMSALQAEFARNSIAGNWNRFLEELDSDISHQQRKLSTYQSPRMNESQKSKLQTEIDQNLAFLEKITVLLLRNYQILYLKKFLICCNKQKVPSKAILHQNIKKVFWN